MTEKTRLGFVVVFFAGLVLWDLPGQAQCLYTANAHGDSISQYRIGTDGSLAFIGPDTITAGELGVAHTPVSVVADPMGRFVFVGNIDSHDVAAFRISTVNGSLIFIGSFDASGAVSALAMHSSGNFLYATIANAIVPFKIEADGTLTRLASPVVGGDGLGAMVVDPSGKYLYVANWKVGSILEYSIDAGGLITPIGTLEEGTGFFFNSLTPSPNGKFLFASYGDISVYGIGPDGNLARLGSVPDSSIVSVLAEPKGQFLYALESDNQTIQTFTVGADGTLTPLGAPSSPTATGVSPHAVAVDPSGNFLFVVSGSEVGNFSGSVYPYVIGRAGMLAPVSSIGTRSLLPDAVATSSCTGFRTDEVTGNGLLQNVQNGTFYPYSFDVSRISGVLTGSFNFSQTNSSYFVRSTAITSLNIAGEAATFGGTCNDGFTSTSTPCTFTVNISTAPTRTMDLIVSHDTNGAVVQGNLTIVTPGP